MTDEQVNENNNGILEDDAFGGIEEVGMGSESIPEETTVKEEESVSFKHRKVNVHIHLTKPTSTTITDESPSTHRKLAADSYNAMRGIDGDGNEGLLGNVAAYVQIDQKEYAQLSTTFPNLRLPTTYLDLINSASNLYIGGNLFSDALDREGSEWRQGLDIDGTLYSIFKPRLGDNKGGMLKGEAALLRVKALTNQGHVYTIPMWNSGICVSFKTPTNGRLLELEETLSQQKIEVGRLTNGLIYSNDTVLLNKILLDFALEHVYNSTLPLTTPETLMANLRVADLDKLIMAMAIAVWADGYPFKRTCCTNPTTCTHVEDELVNLGRLFWVDNSVFNAEQRRIMARRSTQNVTDAELKAYQSGFSYNNPEKTLIKVNDVVTLELHLPSIEEYVVSGERWINSLSELTERTMASRSERERAAYMSKQSQISALQKYGHYFKRVIVRNGDEEETYDDADIMAEMLQGFTSDPDAFDLIMERVGKFINDTAICVVGIPTFNCSKCGEKQTDIEKANPHVIPLEVNRLFFTLNTQHLSRLIAR